MTSQRTLRRMRRFVISGLAVTALHAAVAASLIEGGLRPAPANAVAFAVATLVSYLANTFWSFSTKVSTANFRRFLAVSGIGMLIATLVSGFVAHLGWHYWLGIAAVVATVPAATFLMHHWWTYR